MDSSPSVPRPRILHFALSISHFALTPIRELNCAALIGNEMFNAKC
jgi:hypothetical protein